MQKNSLLLLVTVLIGFIAESCYSQGTAFTYQGRLTDTNGPANGSYDVTFKLFNASGGGSQVGGTITDTGIGISNGLFTVLLDYGAVFDGTSYWLELGVRSNGVGSPQTLVPRQALTPTPYAITAEKVAGFVPGSQLTGTLPGGLLSGTYGSAVNLNNAGNNFNGAFTGTFSGNGSGLTSLNAGNISSGTLNDGLLSPNVALLNRNPQTFIGANIFSGSPLVVSNNAGIDTTAFTGLSLQNYAGSGESAIMSSYTNTGFSGTGFLTFYTKHLGQRVTEQVMIDQNGVVGIDQPNYNAGFLNNGATNGAGLTFGSGSGEGIASQRTAGLNQFGLDFYTSFIKRMSILNNGNMGIGTTNPATILDVRGDIKMGNNGEYFATGSAENLRIVRGIVRADGTIYNGSGFTVTHLGAGHYSITFGPAFADAPSLNITGYTAGSPVVANCTGGTGSGYSSVDLWVGGVKTDSWWNFSAIGAR